MITLKEICDSVLMECGFADQPAYATNTDPDYKQLIYIVNRSNRTLSRYDWQKLRKSTVISLVDGQDSYPLPADMRAYVPNTAYAQDSIEYVMLPTANSYWAYLQADSGPEGTMVKARFINDELVIHAPSHFGFQNLYLDYISGDTVIDGVTGLGKERFTADVDQWMLDDELIVMDCIWRWQARKEFPDWQVARADFQQYFQQTRGDDGGSRTQYFGFRPIDTDNWPPDSPQADLWSPGGTGGALP